MITILVIFEVLELARRTGLVRQYTRPYVLIQVPCPSHVHQQLQSFLSLNPEGLKIMLRPTTNLSY